MQKLSLKIITAELLQTYLEQSAIGLNKAFSALHDAQISTGNFSFYTLISSVYPGKIEGEEIYRDFYSLYKL